MKKNIISGLLILIFFAGNNLLFSQTLRGVVEKRSLVGPVTGKKIEFTVYLPESYYSTDERYPVNYHLHGLGGSHEGNQTKIVPANFEKAEERGLIGPVIIVFPDGLRDSFWGDSWDMSKPVETQVIQELIPYVDQNFRTLNSPRFRAVQGFSMGGFGAAKFVTKFPEIFAAGVVYDGALLNWTTLRLSQPVIAATIFGWSEDYFNQFSPWSQAEKNRAKLQIRTRLKMVVGALVTLNRDFLRHLTSLDIPVDYVETKCLHDLNCLLNAEGLGSASFLALSFRPEVDREGNKQKGIK